LLGSKEQEFYRQKAFFDSFAKKSGFDPSHADNWYAVSRERLLATPVCPLIFDFILTCVKQKKKKKQNHEYVYFGTEMTVVATRSVNNM
jgi:hypothetical protein